MKRIYALIKVTKLYPLLSVGANMWGIVEIKKGESSLRRCLNYALPHRFGFWPLLVMVERVPETSGRLELCVHCLQVGAGY